MCFNIGCRFMFNLIFIKYDIVLVISLEHSLKKYMLQRRKCVLLTKCKLPTVVVANSKVQVCFLQPKSSCQLSKQSIFKHNFFHKRLLISQLTTCYKALFGFELLTVSKTSVRFKANFVSKSEIISWLHEQYSDMVSSYACNILMTYVDIL